MSRSSSAITLAVPLDFQVFQRQTIRTGAVRVAGRCRIACDRLEARLTGKAMDGRPLAATWRPVALDPATGDFRARLPAPPGGWYRFTLRAVRSGKIISASTIRHVGVGEIFVGAGQSNSTNCGGFGSRSPLDGRTRTRSGLVSTFDGRAWRLAHDPQPGTHDHHDGGSFWPAFGDAMAARFRVPIGVAVTGHAGTSIRQWTPGDDLFQWTLARLRALGRDGFRALLWHQGENDASVRMSTRRYADGMAGIIGAFRAALGRDFPFFVAQASYIPWDTPRISRDIRAAQRQLWERRIALRGPDTDQMLGDLRDMNGTGIHLSKKGLKVHGEAWAQKVGAWLRVTLEGVK